MTSGAAPLHPVDGRDADAAIRLLPVAGEHGRLSSLSDLAARLLSDDAPLSSQVSLLTGVQTIVGAGGVPEDTVGACSPQQDSLCTVTAGLGLPLLVTDAPADPRVAQLPPVTSGAVGCYLGIPLTSASGRTVGALCVFGPQPRSWNERDVAILTDIAAAVESQLELQALTQDFQASHLRWELARQAADIGTFSYDLQRERLDADLHLQTLFDYTVHDGRLELDAALHRVVAEDRDDLLRALEAAVQSCGEFRCDFRIKDAVGRARWLTARGRALAGEDGAAVTLLGTAHDVTEVRNARDEAARLLERMATGFLAVDRNWQVRYINRMGEQFVGRSADELVGSSLWEGVPELYESDFGVQFRTAMESGRPLEFEGFFAPLDGWFEVRVVPDEHGLAMYALDVTARRKNQERAEAGAARLALLAEVSAELADAGLAVEEAVRRLAGLILPQLADMCMVSFVDGPGLRDVAYAHRDPTLHPLVGAYVAHRKDGRTDLGAPQTVRELGRAVTIRSDLLAKVLPALGSPMAREAAITLDADSMVSLPMLARGQLAGVLSLLNVRGRPPITDDELATAQEIASRAGLALDNARLYAEQRSLAEALQRSLLTSPPQPDHCEIVVRYVAAAEAASVGGDWFDAFLQPDGATVLVIGDVMGHDTEAAAAMGQLRALLRGVAWQSGSAPGEVLSSLDATMQGLQVDTTATAIVARLEQTVTDLCCGRTVLRWSNAGHPPPIVLEADGSVRVLDDVTPDLLLGIDPGTGRQEAEVELTRGTTVLLYTDGLVERRGQGLDDGLGLLQRTLAELADLSLQEMCDAVLARMLPERAEDDVALLAIRLHPQDRERPAEAGPVRVPPNVPPDPATA